MPHTTQTFKIWQSTLKKLRMLYAITGDSMVSIVDRLVTRELELLNSTPDADLQRWFDTHAQQPPPYIQCIAASPCDPIQVAEVTDDIKFGCDYPIVNHPQSSSLCPTP